MAATVPLCCNLCPQEPEFSDLSHLLTHVSSKGHLAHYLKAQLRGRHELGIRQKLDVYDQWYKHYNIQQLLSQRLSAKVSKQGTGKERENSTKPAKRTRARRSRIKTSVSPHPQRSPLKNEPAIDPQLANSHLRLQHGLAIPSHPNDVGESDRPHTYVPRMSDWQTGTHAESQQTRFAPSNPGLEKDVDEDYFKSFIASPARADYPDLPELKKHVPWSPPSQGVGKPRRIRASPARGVFQVDRGDYDQDEVTLLHSPTLKGIKWPGMSLFDSASLDAQRQRNQKKDRSILEQMAHNSICVEQMEDIYWPDGSLKKRRLITGNVDSSPTSQPSPVSKPSRRKLHGFSSLHVLILSVAKLTLSGVRAVNPRSVLADLDTNGPRVPKKRGRKPKVVESSSHNAGNRIPFEARLAHLDSRLPGYCSPTEVKIGSKKPLLGGNSSVQPHRRAFRVFNDVSSQSPQDSHDGFGKKQDLFGYNISSHNSDAKRGASCTHEDVGPLGWYNELRSYINTPVPSEDSENQPPPQTSVAHGEHLEGTKGRVTQRYFSVTGTEEPQFFDSMPPQMGFGGMAGPRYRGATLNPLNPLNPYFRALQPQSPNPWDLSARGPPCTDNEQHQRQIVPRAVALKREVGEPKNP